VRTSPAGESARRIGPRLLGPRATRGWVATNLPGLSGWWWQWVRSMRMSALARSSTSSPRCRRVARWVSRPGMSAGRGTQARRKIAPGPNTGSSVSMLSGGDHSAANTERHFSRSAGVDAQRARPGARAHCMAARLDHHPFCTANSKHRRRPSHRCLCSGVFAWPTKAVVEVNLLTRNALEDPCPDAPLRHNAVPVWRAVQARPRPQDDPGRSRATSPRQRDGPEHVFSPAVALRLSCPQRRRPLVVR